MSLDLNNIAASEATLRAIAAEIFDSITSVPAEIRGNTKKSTGIYVLAGQPDSRNFVMFPIGEPPDVSRFFCTEKAARASVLGHYSSGNSRNPDRCRYAGCIVILTPNEVGGKILLLQCSISGLQENEDVAGSILVLSKFLGVNPQTICQWVQNNGGALPKELFWDGHYLNKLLFPQP